MRKTILSLGLAVCTCLAVGAMPAVAAPAGERAREAAKPAPAAKGASELVLDQWNDIGRKLTAMAEDFPEDKYEFKPTPAQRTFAAQLLHAAARCITSRMWWTERSRAIPDDPKRDELKTKAQIVAFVKKCIADGQPRSRPRATRA